MMSPQVLNNLLKQDLPECIIWGGGQILDLEFVRNPEQNLAMIYLLLAHPKKV